MGREIARERQGFTDWMERNVLAAADFSEFRLRIAPAIAPAGGKPPRAANG
jgi:hypothetical protein